MVDEGERIDDRPVVGLEEPVVLGGRRWRKEFSVNPSMKQGVFALRSLVAPACELR